MDVSVDVNGEREREVARCVGDQNQSATIIIDLCLIIRAKRSRISHRRPGPTADDNSSPGQGVCFRCLIFPSGRNKMPVGVASSAPAAEILSFADARS